MNAASAHRNFIAGEWLAGPRLYADVNPSDTRDVVGEYALADAEQARSAVEAAHEAIGEAARGQHLQVLRRRGAARPGRDRALDASRRHGRDHARTAGRGLDHHAVEFPHRDPGVEDRPGARVPVVT